MKSPLLDQALSVIRERKGALRARGIELIGVFGSVARGDDDIHSDVDIAYDVTGRSSLLALARASIDLEAGLNRRVDLVDISRIDAAMREQVERDLVRA